MPAEACGRLIDDETWWDDKDALTTQILDECNWIECDGRHYCDECWEFDDDDNIVTKDGRKWTDYDHKEIRQHRMNYLSLSEDMTLTQFRMELVNGKALFDKIDKKVLRPMPKVRNGWKPNLRTKEGKGFKAAFSAKAEEWEVTENALNEFGIHMADFNRGVSHYIRPMYDSERNRYFLLCSDSIPQAFDKKKLAKDQFDIKYE